MSHTPEEIEQAKTGAQEALRATAAESIAGILNIDIGNARKVVEIITVVVAAHLIRAPR